MQIVRNNRQRKKEKVSVKSMEITNRVSTTGNGKDAGTLDKGASNVDYTNLGLRGQIIEGRIDKITDKKISIDFSGTEVTVPKSAVREAREGEIRSFQITEVSKKSIVLKEVEKSKVVTDAKALVRTTVGADKASFADTLSRAEQDTKEENKGLFDRLDSIGSRITGEDYREIEEEGISLESYNLGRLERVLNRIKEERIEKLEGIEDYIEEQEEYSSEIEKIVLHNVISGVVGGSMARQIAQRLEENCLPVTAENIKKFSNLLEMASVATTMSDKAMNYLIDHELEPTIQNVYRAQYAGESKGYQNYVPNYGKAFQNSAINYDMVAQRKDKLIMEENWQEVLPQVEQIIEDAGWEVNDVALKQAKWLFSNELPITDDTLMRLEELQCIKSEFDQEKILVEIVKSYAKGDIPEAVSLAKNQMEVTNQSVEVFLAEVDQRLKQLDQDEENPKIENIEVITKRRQMEEIKLKMTLQVANQLEKKGIDLDIERSEEIIRELRNMEDAYYRGIIYERDGVDKPEHIAILRDTADRVKELRQAPSYVLGPTLSRMSDITLGDLNEEGRSMRRTLERAGEAYNTLMTRPNEELGDSIEKAFGNVDEILESLDMDTTIANRRAVKILGYNGMAINEDNVISVKEYDAQVNKMLKDLHPAITVEMIKRDINPLNTPIMELNEIISEIKEEIGVSGEEKYSKYLWQLEREEGISAEDKKAFIGIYRLLNNVQKSNGAAVGYVLHTNREMTLNNLLSAVTTMKSGKIDANVDENFGLEDMAYTREPLITQVNEAFERGMATKNKDLGNRGKYFDMVVSDLMDEISPSLLEKATTEFGKSGNSIDNLMNKNLEKLLEEMRIANDEEGEADAAYEEELVKNIRNLSENCEKTIAFLNQNKIPVNVQNLYAANQIFREDTVFRNLKEKSRRLPKDEREKVDNAMESLIDGLNSKEEMVEQYKVLESSMESVLNYEYADQEVTSKELSELKMVAKGISLMRNLSKQEIYEIPVLAGDGVTNIHLTVRSGQGESGKVQVQMNSEHFGNVSAEFSVRGNAVYGMLLCSSRKAADTLKRELGDFEQRLNNADLDLGRISYGLQTGTHTVYPSDLKAEESQKDTSMYYQVAKAFVKHIAWLEQE